MSRPEHRNTVIVLALERRSFTLCVADTADVLSGRVVLLRAAAEEHQTRGRSRKPSLQVQAACSMRTDARSLRAWSIDDRRQEIVW